ncbi:PREDICTED: solute carrier family 22 member 7 isoform X3 [Cercocebus atys]|uniref:solute carrier family 22 member 7 isoform X3 n=1 Tax=Cercocebus atys TaxID=9531 RepID=UPI0005F55D28|nr:PREDICTED: solute carrier family 22 member 7 isoform X3 [Cercocebus atys]
MSFEELLEQVGGFGPFQLRNVALLALPRVLLPLHFLLPIFLDAVPAHRCALPGAPANFSHQDAWLEAYIPREPDGTLSSCLRFAYPQALPNTTLGEERQSRGELEDEPATVPCSQGWEYDHSEFSSTTATESQWDLVCEQKGLNRAASTFFFAGVLVGAVAFGYLSDRELILHDPFAGLGGGVCCWWPTWVPESARWLLTQGHVKEAHRYLLHCARLNGRPVCEDSLSQEAVSKVAAEERVVRRPSYLDLFRTPRLRHISLCCVVVWFGVNFSYYGLSLDVSGLGLNVYQTQLLFGAVELPFKLLVYLSVRHAGRRLTQAGTLLGTALALGTRLLVSSDMKSWSTVLAVMGKGFSEAAFTTVYLFTSELYPTVLRQTGMGLTALVGRLGGSLAPLAALLDGVWLSLPKLVYGGIALLAAGTALLLPETRQAQLPETIQDVERKSAPTSLQEEEMPMKQVQN